MLLPREARSEDCFVSWTIVPRDLCCHHVYDWTPTCTDCVHEGVARWWNVECSETGSQQVPHWCTFRVYVLPPLV